MNTLWLDDTPDNSNTRKNNEWYTPARYVEAARSVMGGIDLDPASCEVANQTVRATHFYAREENGLMLPWSGRVWLNPPFSMVDETCGAGKWSSRLLSEYRQRHVEQAIILIPAITDTKWFQPLCEHLMCFSSISIHYHKPGSKQPVGIGYPTAFVYLGPNESRFIETFSSFGHIVRAIDTPAPKPIALDLWTPTTVAS